MDYVDKAAARVEVAVEFIQVNHLVHGVECQHVVEGIGGRVLDARELCVVGLVGIPHIVRSLRLDDPRLGSAEAAVGENGVVCDRLLDLVSELKEVGEEALELVERDHAGGAASGWRRWRPAALPRARARAPARNGPLLRTDLAF